MLAEVSPDRITPKTRMMVRRMTRVRCEEKRLDDLRALSLDFDISKPFLAVRAVLELYRKLSSHSRALQRYIDRPPWASAMSALASLISSEASSHRYDTQT
jgi:hypothetical protein